MIHEVRGDLAKRGFPGNWAVTNNGSDVLEMRWVLSSRCRAVAVAVAFAYDVDWK